MTSGILDPQRPETNMSAIEMPNQKPLFAARGAPEESFTSVSEAERLCFRSFIRGNKKSRGKEGAKRLEKKKKNNFSKPEQLSTLSGTALRRSVYLQQL